MPRVTTVREPSSAPDMRCNSMPVNGLYPAWHVNTRCPGTQNEPMQQAVLRMFSRVMGRLLFEMRLSGSAALEQMQSAQVQSCRPEEHQKLTKSLIDAMRESADFTESTKRAVEVCTSDSIALGHCNPEAQLRVVLAVARRCCEGVAEALVVQHTEAESAKSIFSMWNMMQIFAAPKEEPAPPVFALSPGQFARRLSRQLDIEMSEEAQASRRKGIDAATGTGDGSEPKVHVKVASIEKRAGGAVILIEKEVRLSQSHFSRALQDAVVEYAVAYGNGLQTGERSSAT